MIVMIAVGIVFLGQKRTPPKWEYNTLAVSAEIYSKYVNGELNSKMIPDFVEELDALGNQGWEMVGVFLEHETVHPNFGKEGYVTGLQPNTRPQRVVCLFKRRK